MKESIQQIEMNVNRLLDIYDEAMEAMKEATSMDKETHHRNVASEATVCISREMKKLESTKSFNPEIRVLTSELRACVDTGRELRH